jgi:hypothetical protein
MPTVTLLEPRTPRQPGKLQKVSKNDYGFTLFVFVVNEKWRIVSSEFSIECGEFTGGCSGFGAELCVADLGDGRTAAILAVDFALPG